MQQDSAGSQPEHRPGTPPAEPHPDTTQPLAPVPAQVSPAAPAAAPAPVPPAPAAAATAEGDTPHGTAQGYSPHDETMVLPAFVTGRKEPSPKSAEPARHRPEGALPPSERGMLVFVAALLLIGTIAVVIMLGMGGLNPRHGTPAPSAKPTTGTPSAAAAGPLPTPPVPTESPASTAPAPPPPTKRTTTTPARTFAGNPNPYAYCLMVNAGVAQRPDHDDPSWSCQGRHRSVDFTPDQVCGWQFGNASYAVVSSLPDPSTWKCYK